MHDTISFLYVLFELQFFVWIIEKIGVFHFLLEYLCIMCNNESARQHKIPFQAKIIWLCKIVRCCILFLPSTDNWQWLHPARVDLDLQIYTYT